VPRARDYQSEDTGLVIAAHAKRRIVLGRAATGLGKAVELAMLAQHYSRSGRVMVMVDTRSLVEQLAETIKWWTGTAPGVEMGDDEAHDGNLTTPPDRIIVSTVQTQYSGDEGDERYRKFDPFDFSAVLLDECELFLAPKSRTVVDWYLANPSIRAFGCTATPFRTDGVAMAELFERVDDTDHGAVFDRDILWGIRNGWLVDAEPAFVRVNIDFSTLKLKSRTTEDGEVEVDYSDDEISDKISNEATMIEFAIGAIKVAGDRRTIVVCPKIDVARMVTDYLNGQKEGCARAIFDTTFTEDGLRLSMTSQQIKDTKAAHKRDEFQFLVSVNMLCKGYDDPGIRCVINLRKTKSKRFYNQVMGRGTRPLGELVDRLNDAPDAAARRAIIAASDKPSFLMVNLVGVSDKVRDVTVIDILGNVTDQAVIDRANELLQEGGISKEEAVEKAEIDVAASREESRRAAEEQARLLDELENRQSSARKLVQVKADVEVEYGERLSESNGRHQSVAAGGPSDKQLSIFRKAKVPEAVIARLSEIESKELSRKIVMRWRLGLCTYGQARVLSRAGYSKTELEPMTRDQASAAIEAVKANGWKRPVEASA
jgi:superfamily II DNA or RNA helicase